MLDEAMAAMRRLKLTAILFEARRQQVECHLLAGRADTAVAVAQELVAEVAAANLGQGRLTVQLSAFLGLAQVRLRRLDDAATTLGGAIDMARASGDLHVEALCHHAAAELAEALREDPAPSRRAGDELLARLGVDGRPPLFA